MRQLFPRLVDPVDPVSIYGRLPLVEGRPSVRLNMIACIDGATSVAGVSGGLGGDAKRILSGIAPTMPGRLELCSLCEQDGFLFLRLSPAAQPTRVVGVASLAMAGTETTR